jgi:hypothetical protein
MSIKFIQYLRPNGKRQPIHIGRSADIEEKAAELATSGLCFEAEVLTTGEVSLSVSDHENSEDVAIRIIPNGSSVPKAVDSLIEEAHRHLCARVSS